MCVEYLHGFRVSAGLSQHDHLPTEQYERDQRVVKHLVICCSRLNSSKSPLSSHFPSPKCVCEHECVSIYYLRYILLILQVTQLEVDTDICKNPRHPRQRPKISGTKSKWHYPSCRHKKWPNGWQSVEGQAGGKAELRPAEDPMYMYTGRGDTVKWQRKISEMADIQGKVNTMIGVFCISI